MNKHLNIKQGQIFAAKSEIRRQIFPPSVVLSNVFDRWVSGLKSKNPKREKKRKWKQENYTASIKISRVHLISIFLYFTFSFRFIYFILIFFFFFHYFFLSFFSAFYL